MQAQTANDGGAQTACEERSQFDAAPGWAALASLGEEVEWILGRPCFAVARIAWKLDALGLYKVERKAEAEQAAALHWMLSLYVKHGSKWREIAEETLRAEKPPIRVLNEPGSG